MDNKKNKLEFSKTLLIQESILIWIISFAFIALAFISITMGYMGSLPWLTAMASLPWAAYGVSQVWYYKKSTIENSKDGIKYETILKELDEASKKYYPSINITDNNVPNEQNKNNEIDPFGPI